MPDRDEEEQKRQNELMTKQTTTECLAGILGVTTQRVYQLEEEGVVIRAGRDRWWLVVSIRGWLAYNQRKAHGGHHGRREDW